MRFKIYLSILVAFFTAAGINAQTTINTTVGSTGYTGSTSTSSNSFVTFVVANNSGGGILLTDVGSYSTTSFNGITATLWYSSTSLSGTVGTLGNPTWTQVGQQVISGITSTGVNPFITGMSFLIPNGSTYRFALHVANTSIRYSGGTPTPNNFTANGVSLYTGNYQINGSNVGYVLTLNPRYFTGFISFMPAGPPCPGPTGATATNILSTSATLSWNPVSGSVGYDYVVDQNASLTPPYTPSTITNTTFNKTGLTPSTQYYLHVRNKCSANNPSPWVDYAFTTLPPCEPPKGFQATNLEPSSATLNWDPWPSAQTYDVIVDQVAAAPVSTTGAVNTALTSIPTGTLQENTLYYVHIRSNCAGGQQSWWSLDSFLTPIPCREPKVKIDYVNTDEAVAYWDPVPTATRYEYAITTSPTPPPVGTEYPSTAVHTSALNDGREYFVHVRSHCNSIGIVGTSPWGTASFKTFPVSVKGAGRDQLSVAAYPNPVDNLLTIEVSGRRTAAAELILTNVAGKELQHIRAENAKTNIDMSGLAPGIYFVRYTDQAYSRVIRITKN
jgi:hypothetical protein